MSWGSMHLQDLKVNMASIPIVSLTISGAHKSKVKIK